MARVVSVHVPKAGGTALLRAFEAALGADAVDRVDDRPIDPLAPCQLDPHRWLAEVGSEPWPAQRVVAHGHFPARRFAHLDDAVFLTFLRDPVERALSHYFYWLAAPVRSHSLHAYVVQERLGFLDFVRLPLIRRLHTGVFFVGFDMGRFDLIGDLRHLDRDVQRLGDLLGVGLQLDHVRPNPHDDYDERVEAIRADERLMAEVRSVLAEEMAFHARWTGT